ncbi:MAG TPA: EVE domain-containing protein [bacterium]
MRYWLFKSEPEVFSIDDLKNRPDSTTQWDGVRNYQARNFLRGEIKIGDQVLFYHSSSVNIGVAGVAEVVKGGYPDHTAWDPKSTYYDPTSTPDNPRWYMVDIKWKQSFKRLVPLQEIKQTPALQNMKLVQKGMRLSVQPVTREEFEKIREMGMKG